MPEQSPFAAFVLSTGRCGTQWLAEVFSGIYGDSLRVEHEPLGDRYCARRMLGVADPQALGVKRAQPILNHLASVGKTLETRAYFEAGHPAWASISHLVRRFASRMRIVHLTRHPVPTAYSWVTHGAYVPPLLPHMPVKEFFNPGDAGAFFPEYRENWPGLTPLEKCFYYWAEVQAHGLAWETELAVPWLRISYEEIFSGDGLRKLVDFLGLPFRARLEPSREQAVDQHRFLMSEWMSPGLMLRHPRLLEVAAKLGYAMTDINEAALHRRYMGR